MEKNKLKSIILREMCKCAENIELYYELAQEGKDVGIIFERKLKAFKPGVGDKLIFGKIIDKWMDFFIENGCDRYTANALMIKEYFPYYLN